MAPGDRYELASLGDVIELIVEGWRVERMHYADRSGAAGPPAAFFELSRGSERRRAHVPDDGRALSHRALVSLFRESPHIWKHRSADSIPAPPPVADESEWGEIPEPFPESLCLGPRSLREVVAVNQVQSVDGLDIALTSLERHEHAARLHYLAHASGARARREMTVLDVLAVDDRGRRYRVAGLEKRPRGNRLEGSLALAPAIPAAVSRLTVTVGTVREGASRDDQAHGPWVFPIPLAPAG